MWAGIAEGFCGGRGAPARGTAEYGKGCDPGFESEPGKSSRGRAGGAGDDEEDGGGGKESCRAWRVLERGKTRPNRMQNSVGLCRRRGRAGALRHVMVGELHNLPPRRGRVFVASDRVSPHDVPLVPRRPTQRVPPPSVASICPHHKTTCATTMATPSSSGTTPSPRPQFLQAHPAAPSPSIAATDAEQTGAEERQRAIQKFFANAEIAQVCEASLCARPTQTPYSFPSAARPWPPHPPVLCFIQGYA